MRKTILTLAIIILSFGCTKDDMNNIQAPIPTQVTPTFPLLLPEIVLDSARVTFNTGARDGGAASADLIFFRGSMTSDNWLKAIFSNGTIAREHKIYNKEKVAYLQLTLGLLDIINIDGVFYKHYKILVMYKDSTNVKLVAYSKEGPDNFKYIPTGENLLRNVGHPSKVVSYTVTGSPKPYYNETSNTNYLLSRWQLRLDGLPIKADHKEPTNKYNTQFQPAHSF